MGGDSVDIGQSYYAKEWVYYKRWYTIPIRGSLSWKYKIT